MKKLLVTVLFILASISATLAQGGVTGKVVDVLDGRTLVMETSAGRVTIQLQYLEVPESSQPRYAIVREHLSKLTLGKSVEHKTHRLTRGVSVGRVTTFQGVDLSLQMIRDGAAWHEPRETSEQPADEAAIYASNQELAKGEKRGVWSVAGLKTPWEVRADNERLARAQEAARRLAHPTPVGLGTFHSDTRRPSGQYTPTSSGGSRAQMDAWVNAFSGAAREPHGLQTYADPKRAYTSVYTSALLMEFASSEGKERLECRAIMTQFTATRMRVFLIGFRAIGTDFRFSKVKTRMTVVADGQRIILGMLFGRKADSMIGAEEIMYFRLTWAQLKKISSAKKVEFLINQLKAPLSDDGHDLFQQLAEATS